MSSSDSDAPAPTPASVPEKKKRQGREADAAVIVEGMTALFRGALVGLLNEDAVKAALNAAEKHPAYKKMLSEVAAGGKLGRGKGKGKGKGGGGAAGPKTIRSAYNAFATVAMAHLKASGKPELATISIVGTTWKKLPAHVKARMEERLTLLKDRYNAAITAGGDVKPLLEQLKDMDREKGLDAIDFTHYISKYHGAPAPDAGATPGKAANGPAATPATGDKRKGEEGHHHKDKKEKKKHKKDKKEKEKKHVSDSD